MSDEELVFDDFENTAAASADVADFEDAPQGESVEPEQAPLDDFAPSQEPTEDPIDAFGSSEPAQEDQQEPQEDAFGFAGADDEAKDAPVSLGDDGLDEKEEVAGDDEESKDAPNDAPLKKWQAEREVVLAAQRHKAESDKAEALLKGKEELAKFMADHEANVQAVMKRNRQDENNAKKDLEEVFAKGSRWEQVHKLVDTRPKKDTLENQKNERQRQLLIRLKQEKDL